MGSKKILAAILVIAILIGGWRILGSQNDLKSLQKQSLAQNLGPESIPSVLVSTDKTEYVQGETIHIAVKNGMNVPILYYGGEPLWGTEYFENNAWKNLNYEEGGFQLAEGEAGDACYILLYERMPPDKLDAGMTISHAWNQRICPYGAGNPSKPKFVKYVGFGRYRLTFNYGFEVSSSDSFKITDIETVYSNEFTIVPATELKRCSTDADCVVVEAIGGLDHIPAPNEMCGCECVASINKAFMDLWEQKLKEPAGCVESRRLCKPCAYTQENSKAKCGNNLCVLDVK